MLQALVTALLLLLTSTTPASAAGPSLFGFNDNSTLGGALRPQVDAALLADAGSNSVRVTLDWSWVQPRPGKFQFGTYDLNYAAWRLRGVKPILILTGAPAWARVSPSGCGSAKSCHAPPARSHDRDWSRFVAAVARRYKRVAALEIWNEPNYQPFFTPQPDPVRYTQLLRLAYRAVKKVAPRTRVLGGSLADDVSQNQGPKSWGVAPFLRAMYAHGARGYMNGLSVHAYPRSRGLGQVFAVLDTALEAQVDAADQNPLWLTELGFTTTGAAGDAGAQPVGGRLYRESLQAQQIGDMLPRLLRRPELAGVYIHTLIDPRDASASNPEDGYGLLRPNGSAKPAYCAVMRARGRATDCQAPAPQAQQVARNDAKERVQAAMETALDWHRRYGTYRTVVLAPDSGVEATPAADGSDSVTLCDKILSDPRYCITAVHDGKWAFKATDSLGATSSW